MQLLGKGVGRMGPSRRRGMGLHFVPEERLGRGAVPSMGLAHNLLLTRKTAVGKGGWIRMAALQAQARDIIGRFNVKAGGPNSAAQSLSGGNLQKFIVGREIDAKPRLLIISAHLGVDVGLRRRSGARFSSCATRGAPCWWSVRSWTSCLRFVTACMWWPRAA